ncbi:MAG: glycosyltransferase family 4 protein [Pseudomonadota bacterium]
MKILFLLQDIPFPATEGIRLKAYSLIKYLAKSHECHVLSLGDSDQERINKFVIEIPQVKLIGVAANKVSTLRLLCRKIYNILHGMPPSFATYQSKAFEDLLQKALNETEYDVVHYDIINMAQYFRCAPNIPSVHSPNDATSLSYIGKAEQETAFLSVSRFRYLISAFFMRVYEKKYYEKFSVVHVVSPIDEEYLNRLNPRITVRVAPIIVDNKYFITEAHRKKYRNGSHKMITIVGDLAIQGIVNGLIEFVEVTLPAIQNKHPTVTFRVLGRNASPKIKNYLRERPNLEFFEWVDDFIDFLLATGVVVIPDKAGTGIKNRVLQAMAMGLPVVGTPRAFEGIDMENNVHGMIRSTPAEFCEAILQLLSSDAARRQIGDAANLLIRNKYSEDVAGDMFQKIYEQAVRGRSTGAVSTGKPSLVLY